MVVGAFSKNTNGNMLLSVEKTDGTHPQRKANEHRNKNKNKQLTIIHTNLGKRRTELQQIIKRKKQ